MSRLPVPGQDSGNWGNILNDFLSNAHSDDGALKDGSVSASKLLISNGSDDQILTKDSRQAGGMKWAAAPSAPVTSVNTHTGAVNLSKSDLNLENVDNTADIDKPISTAMQTALNTYVLKTRNDFINLLDYLPTGPDGINNNADIIRQAVIDAANGPKRLFIPLMANPWVIGTPVLIDSDIEIFSDSWGNTNIKSCIKLASGLNDYGFKFDTTRAKGNRIIFRGIDIDGNHASQTAGGIILANNSVQCIFDAVHLHNAYDTALYFKGQQGTGPFGHHNRITNSLFDNSAGFGNGRALVFESTDENMVSNSDFENNGTVGAAEPYHIKDWSGINSFVNCVFVGGGEGIRMQNISGSRVVGCMFDGVGRDSIHISGSNVQISANHFSGINTGTPNNNFHLFLDNGGYCTINGNVFDSGAINNALRGFVSQYSSSTFNIVTGNVFHVNTGALGSGGVYDWNGSSALATNSIIKTNIGLADQ